MTTGKPKQTRVSEWVVQCIGQTWDRINSRPVAGWIDDFAGTETECRKWYRDQTRAYPDCRFRLLRRLTTTFVVELHDEGDSDDAEQFALSYEREAAEAARASRRKRN